MSTEPSAFEKFTMKLPLTRAELAEILGVQLRTVEEWDRAGRIRSIVLGNRKRIPPSEVARIIEEGVRAV